MPMEGVWRARGSNPLTSMSLIIKDLRLNTSKTKNEGSYRLDFLRGPLVPLCAEAHCSFKQEISYPDTVEAGLRAVHIGRSSVRYEIGLFREGESETAADAWFGPRDPSRVRVIRRYRLHSAL